MTRRCTVAGAMAPAPIPIDILKTYEDEDEWDTMEDDFRDKIIPNLLNEAQARIQMEELITDSIKTIGQEMADCTDSGAG